VDRAAKAALITSLNTALKDTGTIVVAHNKGLVAGQAADLRRKVKAAGGSVKVAKNKLTALALKGTKAEGITQLLKGPVILAFSKDPIAAAKAVSDYAKGNDKIAILGGIMDTTMLAPKDVTALANLPSLDELRSKLIGLLNAPATKIARTVKEPGAQLARVIQAQAAKGE
jgi:large subunit ribosomal protein L10